jgi:hypothetical protein
LFWSVFWIDPAEVSSKAFENVSKGAELFIGIENGEVIWENVKRLVEGRGKAFGGEV